MRRRPTPTGSVSRAEKGFFIDRFVVISGCSSGGKSTLLDVLAKRGFAVVSEPGRRIVEASRQGDEQHLPWRDLAAFARRAIDLSLTDRKEAAHHPGWVFFDRGLVDAAVALDQAVGGEEGARLASAHRYHRLVFLLPPWPEIYVRDDDRPHGFEEAVAEYERLVKAYASFGYDLATVPKAPVDRRVEFVLRRLGSPPATP